MALRIAISAADFQTKIQALAAKLDLTVNEAIVGYATTIYQVLVSTTPIATGQARANWTMTLNQPGNAFLPDGKSLHLPQTIDYEAYVSSSLTEISTYKSGDVIYISNNAPYIQALDDGRSSQGSGFIEAALRQGSLELQGI